MNGRLKLTGAFTVKLFDSNRNLKAFREVKNVVVTAGKNFVATWLAASTQAGPFMPYLALGSGNTAATTGDTTLEIELPTRVAGTITSNQNIWQNVVEFSAGVNSGTLAEAGIFDSPSGGTMLARQTFTPIAKDPTDALEVTWQITIS